MSSEKDEMTGCAYIIIALAFAFLIIRIALKHF